MANENKTTKINQKMNFLCGEAWRLFDRGIPQFGQVLSSELTVLLQWLQWLQFNCRILNIPTIPST